MKLLLVKFVVAFFVFTLSAFAQNEMRVIGKGEFQPSELIDKSIRDANGEVCAGLMIISDLTGMRYDSYNGIVKVNQNPGKDFLFLSPDERVVEIFCSGFASLKIILSDYGIVLRKGEVWKLKVTGDKVSDLIHINIVVHPANAQIYVDDKLQNIGSIKVTVGEHKLRIEKEGFQTKEEKIIVNDNNTLFNYTLSEIELMGVQISSNPTGAKIYINGLEKGETNKGLFLYPGSYNIKLLKSGYLDFEEKITVNSDKQNNFTYNLSKNAGTLNISVIPSSATVLINKEKTTQKSIELAPGKYKIEISENGYNDQSETIGIELGKTITKSYSLEPKVGKLQFSVSPPEADVTLSKDGKIIKSWQGVLLLKDLQIGEYQLTAIKSGYAKFESKININEDETTVVDLILEKGILGKLSDTVKSDKYKSYANMIYVEGGTFLMGSEDGDTDEKPIHQITLNSFFIGKCEVTQAEWQNIMGNNPSFFIGDDLPVEQVSWEDVNIFIAKLNEKTGMKFRLPTEAEWEYAARGGKYCRNYLFSGANNIDEIAWYKGNSDTWYSSTLKTNSVGKKLPNELGIFDMSGNVCEWCSDWYGANYYKTSPTKNPLGPNSGTQKVRRGGSFFDDFSVCKISTRGSHFINMKHYTSGFRLCHDAN